MVVLVRVQSAAPFDSAYGPHSWSSAFGLGPFILAELNDTERAKRVEVPEYYLLV